MGGLQGTAFIPRLVTAFSQIVNILGDSIDETVMANLLRVSKVCTSQSFSGADRLFAGIADVLLSDVSESAAASQAGIVQATTGMSQTRVHRSLILAAGTE